MHSITPSNSAKFVKKLMDKKELKLQAKAAGDRLVEFSFQVAGLDIAAKALDKQCLPD